MEDATATLAITSRCITARYSVAMVSCCGPCALHVPVSVYRVLDIRAYIHANRLHRARVVSRASRCTFGTTPSLSAVVCQTVASTTVRVESRRTGDR